MTRAIPPRPTANEVENYLSKWDLLDNYVLQESSLKKLFQQTYPDNNNIDDVLIKVCALNDFYSTHIFTPYRVAQNIVDLDIDGRLQAHDLTVVNDIALVEMNDGKTKNFYSFATKYCSHHHPDIYPIYDSFVDKLLMHLKNTDRFACFKKHDLKNYQRYHDILTDFQKFYSLQSFTLKQIDKYLWQVGKEYFPRKYK